MEKHKIQSLTKKTFIKLWIVILTTLVASTEDETPFHELAPHIVKADWTQNTVEDELTLSSVDFENKFESLPYVVATIPGVGYQSRGPNSIEPNLNGFTGDRINITFNGHPLPASAPSRTSSPINYFSINSLSQLTISHSYPSVTNGPVKIGGSIDLIGPAQYYRPNAEAFTQIGLSAGSYSNWSNYLKYSYTTGKQSHTLGIQHQKMGDYRSGNKNEVDSDAENINYHFRSAFQINDSNQLTISGNYHDQILARNTSLPLDSKDSNMWVCALKHESNIGIWKWDNRIGFSEANINLTAEDRILPPAILSINANSTTRSFSFGSKLSRMIHDIRLETGMDFTGEKRDSVRDRNLIKGTFKDHIWPEIWSRNIGLYAQIKNEKSDRLKWRIGVRLDKYKAGANATNDNVVLPVAKGKTIRDNYMAYNELESFQPQKNELPGAINLVSIYQISEGILWKTGVNLTRSSAGTTEKYRSFVNALGGDGKGGSAFEIGNPSLKPELKKEATTGIRLENEMISVNTELYYATVNHFAQRQIISQTKPVVFGYRGIDAKFYGLRTEATLFLSESISIPLNLTISKGKNKENNQNLVEISPWKSSLGIQYDTNLWNGKLTGAMTWLHVGGSKNPNPYLMPVYVDSEAFDITNISLIYNHNSHTQIMVGIQNLFNETYYHYLTPPIASGPQPHGDLTAGDRIPERGRTFTISLRWEF